MLQESNVSEATITIDDQLQTLKSKHSELELALQKEQKRPHPDDGTVTRLKREKLAVKDEIARLSDE
jgi:hypothetical protein